MKLSLTYALVLLVLFFPKIPLLVIPGIASPLRSDLIFSIIILGFITFQYLILSTSRHKNLFSSHPLILAFVIAILIVYLSVSKNLPVATIQICTYLSLFISAVISIRNKFRFFRLLLNINMMIHLIFVVLPFENIVFNYVNGFGLGSQDTLLGKYGAFGMPYTFASFLVFSYFILPKITLLERILILICMFTCDSRIGILSFLITLTNFKWFITTPIVSLALYLIPIDNKISDFFRLMFENGLLSVLTNDPSLAMRFINIQNFFHWFSGARFTFGGGAQSFLEYSIQYGAPGPLDMGYIRLLTEFGVLGSIGVIIIICYQLNKNMLTTNLLRYYAFIGVFSLVNDGPFALRVGSLFFISLLLATEKYGLHYRLRVRAS